jgi:hypothetical protein
MKASNPIEPTPDELRDLRSAIAQQRRDISRRLLESMCPQCQIAMEPAEPYAAEPDVGLKAFAGGHRCTDCGFEVED